MFKGLKKLLSSDQHDGYTQPQREAMIDLLVWMKFVDGRLAQAEQDVIEETIEGVTWEGPASPDIYLGGATRRARQVIAGERTAAQYLAEIRERLGTAQQEAYDACVYMALADGEEAGDETDFLQVVKAAFEIA